MNILKYICLPGLLVSGDIQTVSAVESKTDKNPNILVILIDDAGYNDFGFMGSKEMQTPNIDALTSERSEERRVGKECRSRWSPYH